MRDYNVSEVKEIVSNAEKMGYYIFKKIVDFDDSAMTTEISSTDLFDSEGCIILPILSEISYVEILIGNSDESFTCCRISGALSYVDTEAYEEFISKLEGISII